MHVEFGEAVHLAPAIEALLDAGVLDLDQRLVLTAQAGAHIAAGAASHWSARSPVFFPVVVGAGPSDETLDRLAYPQRKARWTRARDAAGVSQAVIQGMDAIFSVS